MIAQRLGRGRLGHLRVALLCAALSTTCKREATSDGIRPSGPQEAAAGPTANANCANGDCAPAPNPAPNPSGAKAHALATYRGKIGTAPIVLRLEDGDRGVRGEYFYESRGESLLLDGTRRPQGGLALHESVDGKVTGHFDLTPQGSTLQGEWSSGGKNKKIEVALERVSSRNSADPVTVVTRHLRGSLKPSAAIQAERDDAFLNSNVPSAKDGTPRHATKAEKTAPCAIDIAYPELLELPDPRLERAINQAIRKENGAESIHWPGGICLEPHQMRFEVFANERGVFSYCFDIPTSHRPPFLGARCSTYDIATGETILPSQLASSESRGAFAAMIKRETLATIGDFDGEQVAKALVEAENLALIRCGVVISPLVSLSHASGPTGDQLYVIPFAKLRPFLPPSSLVARFARDAPESCHDARADTHL